MGSCWAAVTTEGSTWGERCSSLYLYDYFKRTYISKSFQIIWLFAFHWEWYNLIIDFWLLSFLALTFLAGIWILVCWFILLREWIPSFLPSLPLSFPLLLFLCFSLSTPSLSDGFSLTSTSRYSLKAKPSFHSLPATSDLFSLMKQTGKEADPSRKISWKKMVLSQVLVLWFFTAGK